MMKNDALFVLEVHPDRPLAPNTGDVWEASDGGQRHPDVEPDVFNHIDDLMGVTWLQSITRLRLVVQNLVWRPSVETGVSRLIEGLPSLQSVTIQAVGVGKTSDTSKLMALHASCQRRGLAITLDIVLDSEADASAVLTHMPTSLTAVLEMSHLLHEAGLSVRWLIPLVPKLVYRLEMLFSLAWDEGVEPILITAEHVCAPQRGTEEGLSPDDRLFAWDFVTYRLLEEERSRFSANYVDYYRVLQDLLSDGERHRLDSEQPVAILHLMPRGSQETWALHVEPRSHLAATLDDMTDNATASPAVGHFRSTAAQIVDAGDVLVDGLRGVWQWAVAQAVMPFQTRTQSPDQLASVMLIGAYGGEHIGDAAILGGVLHRIHQRYGTTQAVLMSQRPTHTRHLLPMLDVPVDVQVEAYEHHRIRARLLQVNAIVFAGGPMTDIPKQLVRHLYTVSLARRTRKPFVMEGIGAGPFVRRPSEWVGHRLVQMAMRVTVRTSDDAQQRVVRALVPEIRHDPAFDYLATLGDKLSRLPTADQQDIAAMLQGTDGRLTIGVNLRPIRHLFTVGAAEQNRADYTRFVESRFEQRFAEGLKHFNRVSVTKPRFVFFPMNAIQFGSSDLRSAYRIQRLLGHEVDCRIWEADASLEGVVALLRQLDLVITMRFHATIFALSQGRPVIDIDYRIGKRDKVGALLDDAGQHVNCSRIDTMSAEWLHERLCALAPSRPADVASPHLL